MPRRHEASLLSRIGSFALRYGFALLGSGYLFTVGFLTRRGRALIVVICRHFGLKERREPTRLPPINAGDLVTDPPPVRLLEVEVRDGQVSLFELLILCQTVVTRKPLLLFEFGTFDGRTTLNLAANSPESARVVTIDLPAADEESTRLALGDGDRRYVQKPQIGDRFKDSPLKQKIEQVLGDTAAFEYGPYIGKVSWVFVDASHTCEYVLNDSRAAQRLLGKDGGLVFWHDYGVWDGVTRALNELKDSDPYFAGLAWITGTSLAVLVVPGSPS